MPARLRVAALLAGDGLLAVGLPSHASPTPPPVIEVLSNRADLISGGDALVAIRAVRSGGMGGMSGVKVTLGRRDVTRAFSMRPNARFEGLVTGLALGRNVLTARLPNGSAARITITNHPRGGPVFSGPHVQPWVCQEGALDAACNMATTYEWQYRNVTGSLRPYDPASPPNDMATTTTDQGVTVPFIIRIETGYQDRDQYRIAVLYDPARPWAPWAPQRQWNHKLLITHGASCGIDHQAGTAPSVTGDTVAYEGVGLSSSSPTEALARGFAVMSTALNNAGHNCNIVTQAESMVMAKEHLVETYGELRYTIGTGCSGGSLTQQQVANAYPGLYQGILPQCSFPDAWSTGSQLIDYQLVRDYVENPGRWGPGIHWTPVELAAVEGHPNHVNSITLSTLYYTSLGDPTNACAGVEDAERYHPQSNPKGVRCTLADYMVNVFGRRAKDGFAGRPLDNVGVQYGLDAMHRGLISIAQFVDLNARIGGSNIDAVPTAERTAADRPALARAYRSGAINQANNLDRVAIIDLRGPDPGAFHDAYRSFAVRARLEREHGTYENHVIWEGAIPLIGDVNYTVFGLIAMDRWLAAVEKDRRPIPLARKIILNRPADVHDQCTDGQGHVLMGETCPLLVQSYTTPRVVAGESLTTDRNKCSLKPHRRSDYFPIEFTNAQWAELRSAFPTGVCDWSRPGVDQQDTIPWMTYHDRFGGRPLGPPPRSVAVGA
ncbi:MAG: DUF6351 family protein [Actinomycetota bacterium]